MRLENKNCLVTGAARGIGRAIAERLILEGARVVGVDRDREALSGLDLPRDRFFPTGCDVSEAEHVRLALNFAQANFGGLDLIVNNAGIGQPKGDLLQTDEAAFDRLFAVNVRSVFLFARYGVPILEKSKSASIVNIGSVIGLRPRPQLTWYAASKGAVNVMTKALAIELAPRGIRVNALCPVATETDMLGVLAGGDDAASLSTLVQSIPLGRLGKPSDVASGVVFLASDEAAFLTGLNIPIDGGRSV